MLIAAQAALAQYATILCRLYEVEKRFFGISFLYSNAILPREKKT
jgi:hypothetical protein